MGADLAAGLAAYAIIMDGDLVTQTWSIGGPQLNIINPLGYPPQGISYSHNKYEVGARAVLVPGAPLIFPTG